MNHCEKCGITGGCGCLYETKNLCKKCGTKLRNEELPLDIRMEMEEQQRMKKIQTESPKPLQMHVGTKGLGDSICALYAVAGLAKTGRRIELATRHHEWFKGVSIEGVKFVPYRETAIDVSNDKRYSDQFKSPIDRKQFYCDGLANQLKIENFVPVNDFQIAKSKEKRITGRYVVLSPFAAWESRVWPLTHWRRLCELLAAANLKPIVLDGNGDGKRLQENFSNEPCTFFWGMPSEWVSDIVQNASCVVGNDSGIAHFGGLLGTPTVAVHSHLKAEHLFSHTEVVSVTPEDKCAGCAWQRSRGYGVACDSACSALMGISAQRVFDVVVSTIDSNYGQVKPESGVGIVPPLG